MEDFATKNTYVYHFIIIYLKYIDIMWKIFLNCGNFDVKGRKSGYSVGALRTVLLPSRYVAVANVLSIPPSDCSFGSARSKSLQFEVGPIPVIARWCSQRPLMAHNSVSPKGGIAGAGQPRSPPAEAMTG
jgi:hypothetical protein